MSAAESKHSRRRFLVLTGSFAAGVSFSWFKWWTTPFEAQLLKSTAFLDLTPGTARAFCRDYRMQFIGQHGKEAWSEYLNALQTGAVEFPLATFLRSTDFFYNGANEAEPIRYMKLFDRYAGCRNPFAVFE